MAANFDGLARWYQWLERLAFGGNLDRARTAHIDQLAQCRNILLLGDGDGRFLKQLLNAAPHSHIHSIDASRQMLALAEARVAPADRARVTFECADALTVTFPNAAYDGVSTMFFLDCFSDEQAAALIGTIAGALTPGGTWLFADFAIPQRGLFRPISRLVVGSLYAFFRWRTGIAARALPDSEAFITRAGLTPAASSTFLFGVLRSVVFRK